QPEYDTPSAPARLILRKSRREKSPRIDRFMIGFLECGRPNSRAGRMCSTDRRRSSQKGGIPTDGVAIPRIKNVQTRPHMYHLFIRGIAKPSVGHHFDSN